MKITDTKELLINEYLALKSKETKKNNRLVSRIEEFNSKEPDAQLTLIMHTCNAQKMDIKSNNFEECCTIAAPIFKILENTTHWGIVELAAISMVIGYNPDSNDTIRFFEEAIDVLNDDDYVCVPKCKSIRLTIYYNLTSRILRAKYYEPNMNALLLERLFKECYQLVIEFCKDKNLPWKYILEARRAVFENNLKLLDYSLSMLDKLGDRWSYRTTRDEIVEYLLLMDGELSKLLTHILRGYQMRKRRRELGIPAAQLAKALECEEIAINAMERGDDGISLHRLYKVARELNVCMDYFCGDENCLTNHHPSSVDALIHDAPEEDRAFIYNMVKTYLSTKNGQHH